VDTRAVVEHHLEALKAGDAERTLSDYTDASVLITGGVVYQGVDALRPVFEGACSTLFRPGTFTFTLDSLVVQGPYALIEWRLSFEGGEITFGTDTFHVVDGKIALQTGAVQMAPA
jgi:ketosteroid isomerase-like protein